MGKSKLPDKSKKPPAKAGPGKKPLKAKGKPKSKPTGKRTPARPAVTPLDDAHMGPVAGVPDETRITDAAGDLGSEDRDAFKQVRVLLAEHLGSDAAARLWLVTPGTGFETTALDAVRQGKAKLVLATLQSQWGPSPVYA